MDKTILLIRHGLAETGDRRRCIGITDVPLSDRGSLKAERIAQKLRGFIEEKSGYFNE